MIIPKLLLQLGIGPKAGTTDWNVVNYQYLENFDTDTQNGTQIDISMNLPRKATSVTFREGYVEINVNGKKVVSESNDTLFYNGDTFVPLDCIQLGYQLINDL